MRRRSLRDPLRVAGLVLATALLGLAAGCGTSQSTPATAPATSEATATAPDTGSAAATSQGDAGSTAAGATTSSGGTTSEPAGAAVASCADDLKAESVQALACAWIAEADPAVCGRMSDRLLAELFGSSGSAGTAECKSTLGGLTGAEDASLVTLAAPERRGKRTTLVVADKNQDIVYALEFARAGATWEIDRVEQVSNAGADTSGETPETVTPNSAGDDGEIAALVTRWYAEVDPGVCDSMTDKMLAFGWGAKGAKGRGLCEQSIRSADPVEDVEVRKPTVAGDNATVEVVYTLTGDRQIDEIRLVRRNGAWLIDSVRLAGFAP